MTEYNNPARRLHNIMGRLHTQWETNRSMHGLSALRQVFDQAGQEKVTAMEPYGFMPDSASFIGWLAEVMRLPQETYQALVDINARELEWAGPFLDPIRTGFNHEMLLGNADGALGWLGPAHQLAVQAAATALDKEGPKREHTLAPQTLKVVVDLVRDARDTVIADDTLEGEVRSYLLTLLLDIESAVVQYDAVGIDAFRLVVERAASRTLWGRPDAPPPKSPGFKKVKRLMMGLLLVIGSTADVYTLTTAPGLPWSDEPPAEALKACVPGQTAIGTGIAGELKAAPGHDDDTSPVDVEAQRVIGD